MQPVSVEQLFQRSLAGHLPPDRFAVLQGATVLVAGLGGGSNIAELLTRKGVGRLIIADPDVFEPHNVRQRGCLVSTLGRGKAETLKSRLLDINPNLHVDSVGEGVTLDNVEQLVNRADVVVDMIDFHGLAEKVNLYRIARRAGRTVVTAPSLVNGAMLYAFRPDGVTFERFFGYEEGLPIAELGRRLAKRILVRVPRDVTEEMYLAVARGERALPLDAVGVDQASVLVASAVANILLGNLDRVVFVPRCLLVDVSDAECLAQTIDFTSDFPERP